MIQQRFVSIKHMPYSSLSRRNRRGAIQNFQTPELLKQYVPNLAKVVCAFARRYCIPAFSAPWLYVSTMGKMANKNTWPVFRALCQVLFIGDGMARRSRRNSTLSSWLSLLCTLFLALQWWYIRKTAPARRLVHWYDVTDTYVESGLRRRGSQSPPPRTTY